MSFRGRLTLFFVLIVIVPMVSVTLVIFRLISDNEQGKASAQVAAREQTAINLEREASEEAARAAVHLAADSRLATALRAGDGAAATARARELLPRRRLSRILVIGPDKHAIVDIGPRDATFPATRRLVADGRPLGTLEVSVERASEYSRLVGRVTGLGVVVRRRGHVLASTISGASGLELPRRDGEVLVNGRSYRAGTFSLRGFRDGLVQVTLLRDEQQTASDVTRTRLLVAAILVGFFVLAFAFAIAVSRSLQRQIGSFLEAARRLGGGRFDTKVPTVGNDEFAALGEQFNTMAVQLEQRLAQLREERVRVERSMRRLGEAVGSNLDRDALLGIVVETAVDGVGGEGGRAAARQAPGAPLEELAVAGRLGRAGGGLPRGRVARPRDRPHERGVPRRPGARSPSRCAAARARPTRWASCRWGARARRSARPIASCSPTSRARRRSRWRTSDCTRRCSVRR